MYSLMERLLGSNNTIIEVLCNSEVRKHSKIWKRWAVALGVEWESILMIWLYAFYDGLIIHTQYVFNFLSLKGLL